MKTPKPFKGEHDDIDRFIGDCNTYFEVFHHQFMGVSSFMVVFATSLFMKHAKDWWTHRREDLWTHNPRNPEVARYRYPHWDDFVKEFRKQFSDPAIMEMHEKNMQEMKMGSEHTMVFFQRLE